MHIINNDPSCIFIFQILNSKRLILLFYCVSADLPFVCTFEQDLCNMFQRTNDQFDWTRQTGGTDSSGTGPSVAASGQWYIYTEASSPRQQGDRA